MNNRVDNTEIAQRKLWELKIALDAGKVMEIIRLLKSGKSQYKIYNPPHWEIPLASNNTVLKIKKALDAGKLDWMTDRVDTERIKAKLAGLGYRKDLDVIAACVARLDEPYNESTWQLYGGKKPLVSKDLGKKIGKDFHEGKLDFLKSYHVDNIMESRGDGFRETRYRIVMEAEEMAPHKWWTIQHMRSIGYSADDARKLLIQYDKIRTYRERATTIEKSEPTTTVMARFRDLQTYLTLLYELYYRTTYPEAPIKWLKIAAQLRVEGELNSDRGLVAAGDDIFRYQVWGMEEDGMLQSKNKCLNAYLESLKRLFKTRPKAYDKLKKRIRQPK